jgi:hypothetical protein
MSTLTVQTISNGTVSTSSANVINGAKAWCRYNGSTQTVGASYNVSSVTRVAASVYRFNFTNAFADANYSAVATGMSVSGVGYSVIGYNVTPVTTSVTLYCIQQVNGTSIETDNPAVSLAVFR